jgi:hypothetical protein
MSSRLYFEMSDHVVGLRPNLAISLLCPTFDFAALTNFKSEETPFAVAADLLCRRYFTLVTAMLA